MAITLSIAIPGVGITEIFSALILLCVAYSMNFCMVIFYVIIMLQDCLQYFCAIGLIIQNGYFADCYRSGGIKDKCTPFSTTVVLLFFVFSIAAVVVAFRSYRIFKSMAMGQMGGNAPVGGGMSSLMRGMRMPGR
jgi:hypothetical protein